MLLWISGENNAKDDHITIHRSLLGILRSFFYVYRAEFVIPASYHFVKLIHELNRSRREDNAGVHRKIFIFS